MADPGRMIVQLTVDELAELVRAAVSTALAEQRAPAEPPLLDRDQLADKLGVSASTVDRLRSEGMPQLKVGDAPRFELEAVLAWLRGRKKLRLVRG